jgi:hypothetical protein
MEYLPTHKQPSPHKCPLVFHKGDQPRMDENKLVGGFTLLTVGQNLLLPQPSTEIGTWAPGRHGAGQPKITVLFLLLEWGPSEQPG